MHKKFEINQTKIKGGSQSGRKVVAHYSKSDLPLARRMKRGGNWSEKIEFPSCQVAKVITQVDHFWPSVMCQHKWASPTMHIRVDLLKLWSQDGRVGERKKIITLDSLTTKLIYFAKQEMSWFNILQKY